MFLIHVKHNLLRYFWLATFSLNLLKFSKLYKALKIMLNDYNSSEFFFMFFKGIVIS